jgi:glycosyltransferase involved in cell wall biosynthesis
VLFLDSGAGFGGNATFLYEKVLRLDRRKFEPVVGFYSASDGPHLDGINGIRSVGVPIVFLDGPPSAPVSALAGRGSRKVQSGLLRRVKHVAKFWIDIVTVVLPRLWHTLRYLRGERFSLVVLNNDVHYHVSGALAARLAGVPVICRKSGGIGEGWWVKKLLTPCVDLFIAISRATEIDQLSHRGTKRVATVCEGVDLKRFDPGLVPYPAPPGLTLPAGRKVVGAIARLERGKGQPEFLHAAASVLQRYQDVVFLIVGGEDPGTRGALGALQALAQRLVIEEHVVFAGWRTDIPEILSLLDVFVHVPTTFLEGLGIANLEAMAMAKPTVVSRNGGLPEAVVDGVTGFVVPPGDSDALAHAILRLLEDPELARRLGRNARRRIEEHFDAEKNFRRMEALFEEHVSAGGHASRLAPPPLDVPARARHQR